MLALVTVADIGIGQLRAAKERSELVAFIHTVEFLKEAILIIVILFTLIIKSHCS